MKWLIYFLLLLNTAFFAWQYQQSGRRGPPAPAPVPVSDGERLLLMSEADSASLRPVDESTASPKEQVPGSRPQETASPATPGRGRAPATGEILDSAGGQVPEERAVGGPGCYSVGPFSSEEPVAGVAAWLRERGGEVESRWTELRRPQNYWIYLPPLGSTAEARAMLRRLKDDDMQDYVRVMRGPMRNAVSLGLYSKRRSAERRMAELRSKGYEPAIHTRYEEQRVQWLDVTFPGSPGLPGEAFRAAFSSSQLSRVDCK